MAMAKPWNPMEDDYKNKNFNKYTQGPGADLDENLQPGAMASRGKVPMEKREERIQLCLKNVPADMSEKALWNLCGNYGKVIEVRRTAKTPYVFVAFATLNDMERALEGIRNETPQGIDADIAKHTASSLAASKPGTNTSTSKPYGGGGERKNDRERYSESGSSCQPDMSKRTILGPFSNPERKKLFERKPFVTEEDYQNSDLKIVDPDRQCLVEFDIHDSDRNKPKEEADNDTQGGWKFYCGRAYYKDSKETTENLKKLHMASKGSYNAEKDEFVKEAPQFDGVVAQIQYCSLCKSLADKICQRCGDYYCSLECQKKDWARHRLFCFPMPELVAPVQVPPAAARSEAHSSAPSLNDSFEGKSNKNKHNHSRQDNHNDEPRSPQNPQHRGFENKGNRNEDNKPQYQQRNFDRQDNRNGEQRQFPQQRNFENKKSDQDFGEKNRYSNDNRQQNNRPGGGFNADSNNQENRKNFNDSRQQNNRPGFNADSNNQENRKNYMNQNQNRNQRDQNNDSGFDSKKDYGRKNDSDNRSTAPSYVSKRDDGKSFEHNKPSGFSKNYKEQPAVKEQPAMKEEPVKKPESAVQIVRAEYPKSGSIVAITSVIKPNKVYIRSMDSEDNVEYVRTINRINNEAKLAKPMQKMPRRSDLAITDFQGEGYYRVCVLNAESEDKILVAYVDFGNVDFKKLSELKEITPELISLKRQALTLMLKDVDDFEPTDKIKEYMNTFVDGLGKDLKLVYDTKIEKGPLVGTLIEVATNESLNKTINEMRNIKPAKLNDEPVFSKDIKFKVLPPGENISLIVLDTSLVQTGAIACVLESDLAEIDKMTQMFAEYVAKVKGPYTPRPHEICLVQYDDNNWYRAECIEVVGDQNPSVLFTDFGNLTTAHIDKIRKYPRELITPCVTLTCLLEGIPEQISTALADRMKELIPVNEKIIVDKMEVIDEQTNSIQLYQVVKTLKAEKLM